MPNYIVRPTSVVTNGGGTTPSTQATVLTNLGDNSDTTTVVATAPTTNVTYAWAFGLGAATIPSDEFPARLESYCRWTGGSGGYLFASGYKAGESTANALYYYDGRATQTTTRTEVRAVNYARTDVTTAGSLRLNLGFQRWTNGAAPTIADTWATIYTIKNATAAVSNVTMTTSPYAIIPVTATATIDWEAGAADSNLSRVITEVRVEQGGTGVGTGTLKELTGKWWGVSFTATGSQVVNVQLSNPLPNGTYNVYARAVRFRENQSFDAAYAAADQTSAWTTAATLTMNNPLPTAPTVSMLTDNSLDRQIISVTPITTSGHTAPKIDIERSDDGGATWTPVRNATGVAGSFSVSKDFYDYECPRGNNDIQYRARVNTTYTGGIAMTSNWTTNTNVSMIVAADWNLKCPENASLNLLDVRVIDEPNEELTEDIGVFRPLDRRYPITVSGALGGWDGDLSIVTSNAAEWEALKPLLEAQKVLLLESNFGWQKYIRIVEGAKIQLSGSTTAPRRKIQVRYVETSAP